jgi:hypothetical protein
MQHQSENNTDTFIIPAFDKLAQSCMSLQLIGKIDCSQKSVIAVYDICNFTILHVFSYRHIAKTLLAKPNAGG